MQLIPDQVALLRSNLTLTGDGNVIGNSNKVTVVKQSGGDYSIQIGAVNLLLPPDVLLWILTSYTPPSAPAPDILPDPGPLPPGFRIPFQRNALFTGRVGPLQALARALLAGDGRSALVEYLSVDSVKANVQAKLQAYGRPDWREAHALLFEYFTRQSTCVGGGAVTRASVAEVLGPPRPRTATVSPLHQLPADLADFTGREDEVRELVALLGGGAAGATISAIGGMGGVGKTALVVHVAHRLTARYAGAQIVVDIQRCTKTASCRWKSSGRRRLGAARSFQGGLERVLNLVEQGLSVSWRCPWDDRPAATKVLTSAANCTTLSSR